MALRYAVATGNWSATATWNGGTLPTSADDVYANAFTVTIDQNVTVLSLRTTAGSPAVAGGGFTLLDGFTLTATSATGVQAGSTACVTYAGTTSATITSAVNGSASNNSVNAVQYTGSGTLTINGAVAAGAVGSNGINCTSTAGSLIVNGNVRGGFVNNQTAHGIVYAGVGTVTVVGNVSGGTSAGSSGTQAYGITTSTGAVVVTGNVTGGGGSGTGNCHGILATGTNANVTVTGLVSGGTVSNAGATGIFTNGSNSYVTVTGNVVGGTGTGNGNVAIATSGINAGVTVTGNVTGGTNGSGSHGVSTSGNGSGATRNNSIVGTVTGTIASSGNGSHGVIDSNSGGGWTIVGGSLIDSAQGDCAVNVRRFRCIPTLNTVRQHANNTDYPSGGLITYGSLDYIPNNVPVPANVRSGVLYGNNTFTGTCAVPAAASVGYGVPVDNTTGTAALTPAAIWDTLTSTITTSGSIGERMKNTATVATTGDQLAATFP